MNTKGSWALASVAMFLAACSTLSPKPKTPDLSGNWLLTTESQLGKRDSDMTVKQTGSALAGTLTSPLGSVAYTGNVEGDAVAFTFTINAGGNDLKIDYAGTAAGDTMQGKAIFDAFGEGTFTARRKTP